MKQIKILMSAAVLATLTLSASPALAQHRGGHGGGSGGGHAVSRGTAGPRFVGPGPRVVGVAPYRFYHPYYVFRPHLSLGFGLWAGYPFGYPYYSGYYPYAYSYPYPVPYGYAPYGYAPAYGYPAPYGYGYPAQQPAPYGYSYPTQQPAPYGYNYPAQQAPGSVGVQPGATASGGVSFEISPGTAGVFIDGTYMGTVEEFGPNSQPLALTAGRHHVEIRAEGYQTMAFDTDVTAGQVIPYRGALQPAR